MLSTFKLIVFNLVRPPVFDWRIFYFSAAEQCEVLVPISSREFLLSGACDDELTYAKDKGLVFMPVRNLRSCVHDLQYLYTSPIPLCMLGDI